MHSLAGMRSARFMPRPVLWRCSSPVPTSSRPTPIHRPKTAQTRSKHAIVPGADMRSVHSAAGPSKGGLVSPTSIEQQGASCSFVESTRPALPPSSAEHPLLDRAVAGIPNVALLGVTPAADGIEVDVTERVPRAAGGGVSSRTRRVKLDALFLRDSCSCPACVNHDSGQKRVLTAHIPANIKVKEARQLPEDGSIVLTWANDHPTSSPEHTTRLFPFELAERGPTPPEPLPRIWSRADMEGQFRRFDFDAFMRDQSTLLDALVQLTDYGLLLLRNVPRADESAEQIAHRVGILRETFYGRTWDVKDKPQAENVAYTSEFLGMHMDLLYMRYPPGYQILHCIQDAGQGGESMFIDALEAAKMIDDQAPDLFDSLATFPVTYHYTKGEFYYRDTKPTFEFRGEWDKLVHATVKHQALSRAYLISAINWSPYFQGPLSVDIGTSDGADRLRKYHAAARMFADFVDKPSNQFRYKMQSNECAIFNNRRVMHGRTEFTSQPGHLRLLKGAYVDTDDILSRLTHAYRSSVS